jgi:signal transduction histidine kinase
MSKKLKALVVEDMETDAELVLLALQEGGYHVEHRRVWSAGQLRDALAREPWDVVISDYSMPSFDAPSALAIVKESALDVPFIIVSGTVGEDLTVAAIKAGAHDYLMKDRLARLAVSVERELREAAERRQKRAAQEAAEQARREREHAESANLAKSRFLANMSHELRTPLNAIIGFSELLEQGIAGELQPKQAEFVGFVLSSAQHLLELITDILDLSKVEAGRMELHVELTTLSGVARMIENVLKPLVAKQGVTLSINIPAELPPFAADPVRLKQVLYNLLSNAIKFTPAGGTVALDARAAGQQLEIAVRDTGTGIRAEDMPRLFHEFEQVGDGSGAQKAGGTGLGLALTKRLVALHGGSIDVESEWGCGSTFTVRLPMRRELEPEASRDGLLD